MLSRRDLIGKAAVGTAAALAARGVGTALAATEPLHDPAGAPPTRAPTDAVAAPGPAPRADEAPAPWALVAPYEAGSALAHGWRLVELTPVRDGAAVVTLANARGRAHRVHLCRNDGQPQGVRATGRIDLVVMNQGYGELPTEEHFGQAVAALARVVAANEATVPAAVFAALAPHAERVQRYAAADGPVADGKLR